MSRTAIRSLIVAFLLSLSFIAYLLFERSFVETSTERHNGLNSAHTNNSESKTADSTAQSNETLTQTAKQSTDAGDTQTLIAVLNQLSKIAKQPYSEQMQQINEWLQVWPYESLLLMRLGKIQGELGQFDEAASHLYEALQYAKTPDQVSKARSLLFYTLNRYGKDLSLSKDGMNLESLYLQYQDTLIEYEGWGELAQLNGKWLLDKERFQELEYFIQDWSQVSAAKADLNHFINQLSFKQDTDLRSSKAIPLRQWGSHYLVSVLLNNNEVNLLIDTGASQTVLTSETYKAIGQAINPLQVKQQWFNTAGGQVEGSVLFPIDIKIGDFEVTDTSIAVLEFDAPYDGLLGMNFLSKFEFEIDQQGHLLFLTLPD